VNGKMIRQMEKENLPILTAMYMMDNGKMIRQMVTEFMYIRTEQGMKDNGLMIFNMVRELKYVNIYIYIKQILKGPIIAHIKVSIKMERSMDSESILGLMVVHLRVIG